jgi:hypothetical protein
MAYGGQGVDALVIQDHNEVIDGMVRDWRRSRVQGWNPLAWASWVSKDMIHRQQRS